MEMLRSKDWFTPKTETITMAVTITVGVHSSMFILKTWSKLCSAHFKV